MMGPASAVLNAIDFHAGETYRIGPKGAARGKNAYAFGCRLSAVVVPLATSCRWCRLVCGCAIGGDVFGSTSGRAVLKLPDKPQVAKALESSHGCIQRKLGFKNNRPLQVWCQEAVARNAKFLRQVGMNVRDRFHGTDCTA